MSKFVARLGLLVPLVLAVGCSEAASDNSQAAGGSKKSLLDAALSAQHPSESALSNNATSPAVANAPRGPVTPRTRPTAQNIGGIMDPASTLSDTGFGGGTPSGPVAHSAPPAGPGGGAPAAGGQRQGGQSGSIIRKTTRDVGDANAARNRGAVNAETKVPVGDPVTVSMSVYKNARFRAAQMQITSGLQAFYAEQGRYPRDYDEFKRGVLDQYNFQLPALPEYQRYGYDAKKRELVILEYPKLKNRGR